MGCLHPIIIGDNYGEACEVCGEVLAGWGYWAQTRNCVHSYDDDGFCAYCGEEKASD